MKKMIVLIFMPFVIHAQITAFPSLQIPASGRGLAMGNTGIASATENQQLFYNAAKTAFTQNFHQVSLFYTPWIANISDDTRFISATYVGNISNTSAAGAMLSYLDMGTISMRDNNGATIASYKAREFNLGGSYALQIGSRAALSVAFRFLGQNTFSDVPKNIYSVCGDAGYYQFVNIGSDVNKKIEWGLSISNLGPKIGLQDNVSKTSLPTTVGVGIGYSTVNGDDGTAFDFSIDVNKMLNGGLRFSSGLEFGFVNQFFLRGGVQVENQLQGNRKFIGLGVGYKGLVFDQSWGIDFHYLVPFGTLAAVSPFQNAVGVTLHFSFGNFQ